MLCTFYEINDSLALKQGAISRFCPVYWQYIVKVLR